MCMQLKITDTACCIYKTILLYVIITKEEETMNWETVDGVKNGRDRKEERGGGNGVIICKLNKK